MIYEDVPQGITTNSAYIVQYSEDVWFSLSEERQQYCKDTWIEFGKPLGLDEVVLRLTPDPIFPMHGKEKPYIHWRHRFSKVPEGQWTEKVTVVINTNDNRDFLGVKGFTGKDRLITYYEKYPKGTLFIVRNLQDKELWRHLT